MDRIRANILDRSKMIILNRAERIRAIIAEKKDNNREVGSEQSGEGEY